MRAEVTSPNRSPGGGRRAISALAASNSASTPPGERAACSKVGQKLGQDVDSPGGENVQAVVDGLVDTGVDSPERRRAKGGDALRGWWRRAHPRPAGPGVGDASEVRFAGRVIPASGIRGRGGTGPGVPTGGQIPGRGDDARLHLDQREARVNGAQVFRVGGHNSVPLLLRHQDDVDVNDVPVAASSAQQADGLRCHVVQRHDPHAGIREQSCDSGLPRAAPPGLRHDAGWHAQGQAGLQSPPKKSTNPRAPALKRE